MRILKHLKVKRGTIYLHCSLVPVRCTYVSRSNDDISGKSLLDGAEPYSCSIRHCRPQRISQAIAEKLVKIWRTEGERGALRWRGWKDEQIDQFFKDWREPLEKKG